MFLEEMSYPSGTRVLVWRLEEEASRLLSLCHEAGISCEDLTNLPDKRQREKAAERLLLCHAFGYPVDLEHTHQGAPYVKGLNLNISISHTQRLVALALDEQRVIGIDAELVDRRQVLRVRDKFLNAVEQQFIAPDDQFAHVVAWTAKEAIIKAERNSALDWTDGICLDPFSVDMSDHESITFTAHCGGNCYCLQARPFQEHFLTIAAAVVP